MELLCRLPTRSWEYGLYACVNAYARPGRGLTMFGIGILSTRCQRPISFAHPLEGAQRHTLVASIEIRLDDVANDAHFWQAHRPGSEFVRNTERRRSFLA